MRTVEAELRAELLADFGVAALIASRLYWRTLPQDPVYPAVTYDRTSTTRLVRAGSPTGGSVQQSVGWTRVTMEIWDNTPNGSNVTQQVHQAIKAAMANVNLCRVRTSPATAPKQAPNTILAERCSTEPQPRQPIAKYTVDWKVWFDEENLT
jgi:hypothetical protein